MAEVVIGEKNMGSLRLRYNAVEREERGERKSYDTEEEPHQKVRGLKICYIFATIVMGAHLVGFLINECYGTARLIPYVMLADTIRGNGCVCNDENGGCVPKEEKYPRNRYQNGSSRCTR